MRVLVLRNRSEKHHSKVDANLVRMEKACGPQLDLERTGIGKIFRDFLSSPYSISRKEQLD